MHCTINSLQVRLESREPDSEGRTPWHHDRPLVEVGSLHRCYKYDIRGHYLPCTSTYLPTHAVSMLPTYFDAEQAVMSTCRDHEEVHLDIVMCYELLLERPHGSK